ncbi:MAG TPA: sigma-70 family RNA polymerase sigma factor [bacterium]|nr:sigma-70 family RNA polymerase sigma factor [bacterium]
MRGCGGTDEWLMERVATGDDGALEELMRRYHSGLLAFIRRNTDSEPEDIYQETWINVVRARNSYRPGARFAPWMFRIALNLCRDAHRRRKSRPKTVELEAAANSPAPSSDSRASEIRDALAMLDAREREVLELRYYQGYSEAETASILGIPEGTVKSRAHNAVKKIKNIMGPNE